MTLRERIANWITGGRYAHHAIQSWRLASHFLPMLNRYEDALLEIEKMETPAAKVAKEALNND